MASRKYNRLYCATIPNTAASICNSTTKNCLPACLPQYRFLPKRKKVRDLIPLVYPDGKDQELVFMLPAYVDLKTTVVGKCHWHNFPTSDCCPSTS